MRLRFAFPRRQGLRRRQVKELQRLIAKAATQRDRGDRRDRQAQRSRQLRGCWSLPQWQKALRVNVAPIPVTVGISLPE
jgi:hypothetical protein